jgi:fructose-bisphosphate aldolase, class I
MNAQELIETARALVAGDKGMLAMNQSNPTFNKRFARLWSASFAWTKNR